MDDQQPFDAEDLTPDGEEPTAPWMEPDSAEPGVVADPFEEAGEPENPAAAASGGDPVEGLDPAADELAALRHERDELDARLKRTAADYQNYVRRSAREVLSAREQGKVELVRSLITGLDHLDRALGVDADKTTAAEVQQGLASTIEELSKSMAAVGVNKITPEPGDEFDPNVHEALMHMPAEGIESGHVAATLMPGYLVGDVPVRPAQVSVAQ